MLCKGALGFGFLEYLKVGDFFSNNFQDVNKIPETQKLICHVSYAATVCNRHFHTEKNILNSCAGNCSAKNHGFFQNKQKCN